MKKTKGLGLIIIIFIGLFFNIVTYVNGQNLTDIYYFDKDILFSSFLSRTKDLCRIETYTDGVFIIQRDYVTEGNKTTVYSRDIKLKDKPHITAEYIFDNNNVESNYYYPSGYRYWHEKHIYLNGLLKTYEWDEYGYGDNILWNSEKYEYFYDPDKNLVREICKVYEKKYSYSAGKLILIEYFFRDFLNKSQYFSEKVEYIGDNIVHSPCYDFYFTRHISEIMDKKVIENKLDGKTRTTTIKYFHRNGQVYQEKKYIFVNDRIENIMTDRYIGVYPDKVRIEKTEYKYFYN